MSGTLSCSSFKMALVALERIGVDADPILKSCGISRSIAESAWARVSVEKARQFWREAIRMTGDPQLGVRLGGEVPFGTFPLLDYGGASCAHVFDVLCILRRYSKVIYGGWRPEIDLNSKRVEFRLGELGTTEEASHTTEFGLAFLWDRMRAWATTDVSLISAHFRHAPLGPMANYHRVFGAEVFFEASEDMLVFPSAIKAVTCRDANALTLMSLLQGADILLNKVISSRSGGDLIQSVKTAIATQVSDGDVGATEIAARLGLSRRTFQRRLEIEGRSFRALVSEVRRESATKLLVDTDQSVEQIGLLIGYSTLKAFSRAFSEWYRMTPAEFRRQKPLF